jgi:glycosyltransferase involved in cell wall biosynthesis
MRIGMMADAYKPHVSGVTNVIALSKRFLELAGYEVYVFTFGGGDYQDDEPNIVRTRGMPLVDTGLYFSARHSSEAQKIINKMDILHVHHPFTSGQLAIRYSRSQGIPLVFTNHTRYDLYAHAYLPMVPEALGDAFLKAYLPSFCKSCDLVIAPSPGLQEVLINLGVEAQIDVIPNGVDIKPFQSVEKTIPRQELGFKEDDVIITYMGRIGPEKNLPFLLRAFAGIAKTYDNVGLLIIGDGAERENLEDRVRVMGISDRVHFTGMIPYQDLPAYMAGADAFATASITEVHPLSVIEALASGLPVIGIQSPGVGDTVEDGVTGFLASEEDLAVFTAKLSRIITDRDMRIKMSEQAKETAKIYSIENTTQIMIDRYQKLYLDFEGKKRGIFHRITQPFRRKKG